MCLTQFLRPTGAGLFVYSNNAIRSSIAPVRLNWLGSAAPKLMSQPARWGLSIGVEIIVRIVCPPYLFVYPLVDFDFVDDPDDILCPLTGLSEVSDLSSVPVLLDIVGVQDFGSNVSNLILTYVDRAEEKERLDDFWISKKSTLFCIPFYQCFAHPSHRFETIFV